MTACTLTTIDSDFIKSWRDLWLKSPEAGFANSPDWFLSYQAAFKNSDYRVIAVYNGRKLQAVAYFFKEQILSIPVYTIPPGEFVFGNPFLVDISDKTLFKPLLKEISKLKTVFLDNLSGDLIDKIAVENPHLSRILFSTNYFMPLVRNNNGEIKVEKRHDLARKYRRYQSDLQLKSYSRDLTEAFPIIQKIDSNSRKQERGYGVFADQQISEFYQNLFSRMPNNIIVDFLYLKDQPIAYSIGFRVKEKYYGSQLAYISKYAEYAPGKSLLLLALDNLEKEEHISFLDLGTGDSHLKHLLTKTSQSLYKVIISQNPFIRIYFWLFIRLRVIIYSRLERAVVLYSFYRKIKKFLRF